MNVRFLFDRPGNTPKSVAEAVGVDLSTAYRWKHGQRCDHVAELVAAGLLTVDDLKRRAKRGKAA